MVATAAVCVVNHDERRAGRDATRAGETTALAVSGAVTLILLAGAAEILRRQNRRMRHQAALFESILESIGDAVLAVDMERRFMVANAAARRMFLRAAVGERLPANWAAIHGAASQNGEPLSSDQEALWRAAGGQQSDDVTFFLKRADRAAGIWVSVNGRPVRDADGRTFGGVAVYRDVSEQRRQAEELQSLSLTDELTTLTNRRGFVHLAEQHARLAARTKAPFALLFADMNGLKTINDALGHEAGDRAICDIGRLLRSTLRETDIVARLGGDEFVALLTNAAPAEVEVIEQRLHEALQNQNVASDNAYGLSISTGVAVCDPDSPRSIQELLVDADHRMYANKSDRWRHVVSVPLMVRGKEPEAASGPGQGVPAPRQSIEPRPR